MIEISSPCLIVLVGPAGCGKSTWAAANFADHVVSSDDLRALVGEGEHDLRASADAFAVLDEVVRRRMHRRLTTVIDTLGTDAARRAQWRDVAARHRVPCVAVVFDVDAARVRRQNRGRTKRVPDDVLRRQLAELPATIAEVSAEGFDAVHIVTLADDHDATAVLVAPGLARVRSPSSPSSTLPTPPPASIERSGGMRFGLQIPQFTWPGGPAELGVRLRGIARRAEERGFDSLWLMDHFRQIPSMGPPWNDMLDSWTTLGHLAACTESIRIGTMVTGITYRNVAHLAKIVATLDVLSGGRVTCGIGLGWFADEHRAYDWPFPTTAQRYALLEDALQLLPRMWGPGAKPFEGRVLRVPDTSCYPRPLQSHVPILIGGSGERKTLRLVAQYADACNLFGSLDVVARKIDVLRRHCAEVGRDPDEIAVTHLGWALIGRDAAEVRALVDATRAPRVSAERHAREANAGTVEQHADRVRRFAAAGVTEMIVSVPGLAGAASLDGCAALIAAIREQSGQPADP